MTTQFGDVIPASRGVVVPLVTLALVPLVVSTSPARATDDPLSDGDALVVGEGSVYALNLDTAALSPVATLQGDTPIGAVAALEANPSDDTVVALDQADLDGEQLLSIDATDGSSVRVGNRFSGGEAFHGIARTNSGETYVTGSFDDGSGNLVNQLATLDLTNRTLSTIGETQQSGTSILISALFSVDDDLYGFGFLDVNTLYSIDTSTGALTKVDGFVSSLNGSIVAGADTTASGGVYLVTTDGISSWLSSTELSTTSEIGQISGGVIAENLAIATLLDSERTEPEPEPEPEPDPDPDPERDEESDAQHTSQPEPAPEPDPQPAAQPLPQPTPAPQPDVEPQEAAPTDIEGQPEEQPRTRERNSFDRGEGQRNSEQVAAITAGQGDDSATTTLWPVTLAVLGLLAVAAVVAVFALGRLTRAHSERPSR